MDEYLKDQASSRDSWIYKIPTTPAEDQKILDAFNKIRSQGYSISENRTCSTAASEGLKDLGVFKSTTQFPLMLKKWFDLDLGRRGGIQRWDVPKGGGEFPKF